MFLWKFSLHLLSFSYILTCVFVSFFLLILLCHIFVCFQFFYYPHLRTHRKNSWPQTPMKAIFITEQQIEFLLYPPITILIIFEMKYLSTLLFHSIYVTSTLTPLNWWCSCPLQCFYLSAINCDVGLVVNCCPYTP